MRFRAFLASAALLCGAAAAHAASLPYIQGPTEPPTLAGPLNSLINQINGILSPLTGGAAINGAAPGTGAVGVNSIAAVPGVTGAPALITVQPGGDPNGSIQIQPDPSGNIILFGNGSTGNLVVQNPGLWVPANGLTACPGIAPGSRPMGMKGIVSGYLVIEDWLGRQQWSVNCG